MTTNNSEKWASYEAKEIPTKRNYDRIIQSINSHKAPIARILDFGCGNGEVAQELATRYPNCHIHGVDINREAIDHAEQSIQLANTSFESCNLLEYISPEKYDVVVLQLVISVIGTLEDRRLLLQRARDLLVSGGLLYVSASGVSDHVNENYRKLYEQDEQFTGERYTYHSRDSVTGEILYTTHHFSSEELTQLLEQSGYENIHLEEIKETSSRRPDEASIFVYAHCAKR